MTTATHLHDLTDITCDLDGPTGPRVQYPIGADTDDVNAAAPDGWEVDWDSEGQRDNRTGWCWRPLRNVRARE